MTAAPEVFQSQTSEASAMSEIVLWSAELPPWQRDALRRLCTKDRLDAADLDDLVSICKGGSTAAKYLQAADVRDPSAASVVVTLKALSDIQNVNALAIGEKLTFDGSGLTVIYGDNGSGKSGYARVLKQMCRARSPKDEAILPNVYASSAGVPSAVVDFSVNAQNRSFCWTSGAAADPMLSAISVFDSATASIHVDQTNDVAYTPLPLKVLAGLAEACQEVKAKLNAEIAALKKQTPLVLVHPECHAGTAVGRLIAQLSASTRADEVAQLATLQPADEARLTNLNADLANDPTRAARQILGLKAKIDQFATQLEKLATAVSDEDVAALDSAAEALRNARVAAEAASSTLFSGEPLPDIGSNVWKLLWEAAREYSQQAAFPGQAFPVVAPSAVCVLCQQELNAAAADRLQRFEAFIRDDSEQRQQQARQHYDRLRDALREANFPVSALRTAVGVVRDELGDSQLAESLRRSGLMMAWRWRSLVRRQLNDGLSALPPHTSPLTSPVRTYSRDLEVRAAALQAEKDSPERRALIAARDELADRAWLAVVKDDVLAQISRLKAIDQLAESVKETATNRITSKSAILAEALVTNALRSRFAKEIDRMGVAGLAIELRQDKTAHGVPFFRVSLINKPSAKVGDVLSEGEHRSVALAAFLAELATVDAHSGIVFDDPVSSLDHMHREKVAERLVDESETRQVIVFTHDIAFLFLLYEASRERGTHMGFRSVSRGSDFAGFIQTNPPPNAQPLDKVIDGMESHLANRKIHYDRGHQEEWYQTVHSLQEQLRTAWERAVEEALSPVIRRLSNKVDTKGLARLTVIELEDCRVMREAFGRCSELLHSQPGILNPALPGPTVIEAEITALRNWITDIRGRQSSIN